MIHLDTHILVWLYQGRINRLSKAARALLRRSPGFIVSPMVLMELDLLLAARRIKPPSVDAMFQEVRAHFGELSLSKASFLDVVDQARRIGWTTDPFDQLIVANAMADGAKLVTADDTILAHFSNAVWD